MSSWWQYLLAIALRDPAVEDLFAAFEPGVKTRFVVALEELSEAGEFGDQLVDARQGGGAVRAEDVRELIAGIIKAPSVTVAVGSRAPWAQSGGSK